MLPNKPHSRLPNLLPRPPQDKFPGIPLSAVNSQKKPHSPEMRLFFVPISICTHREKDF